ncbi:YibE/F family protein [Candidatus Gracilibacteria bacterium]|nr:YibE/F family protein [Candidatus Gracilibacteria bacterium]
MKFFPKLCAFLFTFCFFMGSVFANEFAVGEVLQVHEDDLEVELLGKKIKVENNENFLTTLAQETSEGEKMVMGKFEMGRGKVWQIYDKYRSPHLLALVLLFFILIFLIGGKRGLSSLLGLAISISIILFGIIPFIASGLNPLLVALVGGFAIAGVTIFIAHGFSRNSFLAFLATIFTLLVAALFACFAISFTKIFGTGSEESFYFLSGEFAFIDLRGLLFTGILLGTLGVLDDITVAQIASISEIQKANPKLSPRELFVSAMKIGREHIASMINTLALAYVGVSLPLILLLFLDSSKPLWVILNSEFVAEEIVRVVVGSSALILAAPIASFLGAYFLRKRANS